MTPAARGARGLDHHDRHVAVGTDATGHHHLERGLVAVGVGGMRDPLAVGGVGDPHSADRATERDARDSQRGRGGVERQNVVGVLLVGAQHETHDVDLIAEPVREGGPQRAVDQPAGQGGLLAGPALPAEEGAGDLAGGEHPLLDVDGQREEVGSLPCARGRRGGDEHFGPAEPGEHGAPRKRGQPAGLHGHCLVIGPADDTGDTDCLTHCCFLSG